MNIKEMQEMITSSLEKMMISTAWMHTLKEPVDPLLQINQRRQGLHIQLVEQLG
jgi:glycerol-3-phosphate responsive antiterminator